MKNILVIPDGDRRYAKKEGISQQAAYKKAAKIVRKLPEWILIENNAQSLTFFGLSYANIMNRNDIELDDILQVQKDALLEFSQDSFFINNNIKIRVFGEKKVLPKDLISVIGKVESSTSKCYKKQFNLLIGYSGALELTNAINKIILNNGIISSTEILLNCDINFEIDLIIRTANEKRLSDSPLLPTRYSEYVSIEKFFPELTKFDINTAINQYNERKRTFGK